MGDELPKMFFLPLYGRMELIMDKKIRNLLILVGILAVLCIGYAVTGILVPDEVPAGEAETEEGTTVLFRVTEDGLTALRSLRGRKGMEMDGRWSCSDWELPLLRLLFYFGLSRFG